MKVGLLNAYSARNLGDAAIYSGIAGACPGGGAFAAQDNLSACTWVWGSQDISACDAYVGVGGDIFNNTRKHLVTRQFVKNLAQLMRDRKRTFVFGQSIPRSCDGVSFHLLAEVFRRLAGVCVRDAESHRRLRQAGVDAVLSYDAAFALRPLDDYVTEARTLLDGSGVSPERAAVISIRTFDSLYPRDTKSVLRRVSSLGRALVTRGYQPVVLIQSDVSERDSDTAAASALAQHCPQIRIVDPSDHASHLTGWQVLLGILSCCPIAVGIRYHTSVLRLVAGRLPFNLYYSNKGQDLSQRLGVPGVSIDEFNVVEHLPLIERHANATFDVDPIRRQLDADFSTCLRAVAAKAHRM